MRVRMNIFKEFYYEKDFSAPPKALNCPWPLIIVIDPGKTNMAMYVGTPAGHVIRSYEFSGKGEDTTVYCEEFKAFMRYTFAGCNVVGFGQEKAIHKKGFEYYRSQMVLTEIRAILLELSREFGWGKSTEINNWSWKNYALPKKYHMQSQKGSKLYLPTLDRRFEYATDDLTDVACMYSWMCHEWIGAKTIRCDRDEPELVKPQIAIVDQTLVPADTLEFFYNPEFSLEQNAIYFANRRPLRGYCRLNPEKIAVADLFRYGIKLTPFSDPALLVRCGSSGGLFPEGRWL